MCRREGSADEKPDSRREAGCQPSTLAVASGGWAGGETARSAGDHGVEQDHDLASGAGWVVSPAVPFGRGTHPSGGLAGTRHLRLDRQPVPHSVTTHPTQRDFQPALTIDRAGIPPAVGQQPAHIPPRPMPPRRGAAGIPPRLLLRGHRAQGLEVAARWQTKGDHSPTNPLDHAVSSGVDSVVYRAGETALVVGVLLGGWSTRRGLAIWGRGYGCFSWCGCVSDHETFLASRGLPGRVWRIRPVATTRPTTATTRRAIITDAQRRGSVRCADGGPPGAEPLRTGHNARRC